MDCKRSECPGHCVPSPSSTALIGGARIFFDNCMLTCIVCSAAKMGQGSPPCIRMGPMCRIDKIQIHMCACLCVRRRLNAYLASSVGGGPTADCDGFGEGCKQLGLCAMQCMCMYAPCMRGRVAMHGGMPDCLHGGDRGCPCPCIAYRAEVGMSALVTTTLVRNRHTCKMSMVQALYLPMAACTDECRTCPYAGV